MPRPEHPDKDIEAAVRFAETKGWRVVMSNGHAWARLYCPGGQRGDCRLYVYSTPSSGPNHARRLIRRVKPALTMEAGHERHFYAGSSWHRSEP